MRRYERVLVVSPHADDEVLGCGGLLARLADAGAEVHVLYLAVDGMAHYGLTEPTTYRRRIDEIETVSGLLGFRYEIVYGDQQLTERLDTLPRRELVDLCQERMDRLRPDLLLLPSGDDYDQDHVAAFAAGFAAARPIGPAFGKWLVPTVLSYEMSKLQWATDPLARCCSYVDVTDHLDRKLAALRAYATQHRGVPHIRSEQSVSALACIRGAEVGVGYAEAFEVHRILL
ncbi:PIG-L deacetylase family protein [Micromonospora sp. DT227]|uniref:PIG-L deacetylase family protein n=1 Tax=Micromonospora sp. DT227 TaxID=3393433 RepID=UPI003CEEAE73